MGFEYQGPPRCSRPAYWGQFAINVVAIFGLLGYSIYSLFNAAFGTAILCFVLVIPVGIYFRVVMMRRCRDIGWPAALPWIFFGAGILANMVGMMGTLGAARGHSSMSLATLVGLVDLVFMIVIGCIPSRDDAPADYAEAFRGGPDFDYEAHRRGAVPASRGYEPAPAPAQPVFGSASAPAETEQEARWDAAIAAALAARGGDPAPDQTAARPAAPGFGSARPIAPAAGAARPGGFGRRVV